MSPSCLLQRRRLVASLEGGLRPGQARRLERHLAGCTECAGLFSRIKAGHEAARSFGRLRPDGPARFPSFEEMRAAALPRRALRPSLALPALLAVAAGLAVILAVAGREPGRGDRGAAGPPAAGAYMPLPISEFGSRSGSRVVTEGFVRNVYFDQEERTLHIKLTEGPRDPGPFVICEIWDPRGLAIPSAGSRVRVSGKARFDAQPGRGWHEVNPVMEIAVLNR